MKRLSIIFALCLLAIPAFAGSPADPLPPGARVTGLNRAELPYYFEYAGPVPKEFRSPGAALVPPPPPGQLILQIQNQGTTVATWIAFGILNCSTNMTCTASGSTVSMASSGGTAAAGGNPNTIQVNTGGSLAGITAWTSNGTTTMTAGATGILDLSGITTGQFKVPSSAGNTASATKMLAYDSTAGSLHAWNGADNVWPQALANVNHKWLNSFTATTGAFTQTQPATTDMSDYGAVSPTGLFGAAYIEAAANGGTGVNNTATLTLGSSNVNLATLGTGIVYNTTTTGALTNASAAQVVAVIGATAVTNATNAANIATTGASVSGSTFFPAFVASNTSSNQAATTTAALNFVPSTGVLSSTSFTGAGTGLTGTAAGFTAGAATALASYTGYSVYGSNASAGVFITPTGNGQCLMAAASNYTTTTPSFQNCPGAGSVSATTLTSGYIPQATGASSLGNTNPVLDNSITNGNGLTYAGSAGVFATAFTGTGSNGGLSGVEGTGANAGTPGAGVDILYPDSTLHNWHGNINNTDVGALDFASNNNTLTNKSIAGSEINSGSVAVANGGTGATTAGGALINLFPAASEVGDLVYCSAFSGTCTAWTLLPGNTSGTKFLQETNAGAPSWSASGAGTVTVVSAGTLGNTQVVTGGGSQTLQTPCATCTMSAGGVFVTAAGGSYGSADTGSPAFTFATNKVSLNQPLTFATTTNQFVTGTTTNLTTSTFPASSGAVTVTFPNVTSSVGYESSILTINTIPKAAGTVANLSASAIVDNATTVAISEPITGTTSLTLGTNGGTGGSVVINGSASGSATINASSTGVLALPSGTTATSMALTTPLLGIPTSGTATNITGLPMSGLVSATGAIPTIADGNNPLVINCALTSGTTCLTTGETTAATTAGAVEDQITTLTTTTAIPLQITQGAAGPAAANAPNVINVSAAAAGGTATASAAGNTGAGIQLLTGAGSAGGATTGNGGVGGAFTVTEGAGGAGGGTTTNNGGQGGGIAWTTGAGGAAAATGTSGNGGNATFTMGVGGTTGTTPGSTGQFQVTGTQPASQSGIAGLNVGTLVSVVGVTGGNTSHATSAGGNGSAVSVVGGTGGNGNTSGAGGTGGTVTVSTGGGGTPGTTGAGGAGGALTVSTGSGTAGGATSGTGGAGGALGLTAGAGGAQATSGAGGAGGSLTLTGGAGGNGTTAGGNGGSINLVPGAVGTGGTGTAGVVAITGSGILTTGTAPTVTTPGTGFYVFGTEGTEPASIASGTTGVVEDSALHCNNVWNNAVNMGCVPVNFVRQITAADWTCGTGGTNTSCVTAQTIGTLTWTLPLIAANWTMDCTLIVGQATGATANNWNLQTATNGATNVEADYSQETAATAIASGVTTGQGSTTTTFNIGGTWTQGGTGTKMPAHIHATIEGSSASGTVVNLQLVAPTIGDLVTIYRGSSCTMAMKL